MKNPAAITFTISENMETGETIVSPGICDTPDAFHGDDGLMNDAYENDLTPFLSYRYRVYVISFGPGDTEPASYEMVQAFQELIDVDEPAFLDLADLVSEGEYEVLNPYFEEPEDEEDYTPSSTMGDYGPGNPWDAPGMSIRDFL